MFGLSAGHLLIVAVVALLVFGRRLPELGSALGKGLHAFKKGIDGSGAGNSGNDKDSNGKIG